MAWTPQMQIGGQPASRLTLALLSWTLCSQTPHSGRGITMDSKTSTLRQALVEGAEGR